MGKKKQYKLKELSSFPESKQNYFNRELSWIKFNERVFHEAENPENPLMERVGYLSIVGGNLDEFFSVRIPPYQHSTKNLSNEYTNLEKTKDQLGMIYFRTIYLMRKMSKLWNSALVPELKKEGITFMEWEDLSDAEKETFMDMLSNETFTIIRINQKEEIANPVATGMVFGVELGTSGAVVLVQDIIDKLGRILPVGKSGKSFIFIENILVNYIEKLFLGEEVYAILPFRLTRDTDLALQGDDAEDLYEALKKAKQELPNKQPSRLETVESAPYGYMAKVADFCQLPPELVYDYKAPLGLKDINQITVKDRKLYYPSFIPSIPNGLEKDGLFDSIKKHDCLLFTPYNSFNGLLNFLNAAAEDAKVTKVSITLYRLGSKSPVADALIAAAKRGAKVTAVIELKASFDEERNFMWAEELKTAGVTVIHGPANLKTHGKCCLVTRREGKNTAHYGTISTGNYNAKTAEIYTDFSLFTADKRITDDLVEFFKMLENKETKGEFKHLLISPKYLENGIMDLINNEIKKQKSNGNGRIIIKTNSLTDTKMIDALYAASSTGVKITLLIRGICMLRPGVPNLSENITVLSTVGRFLEHARVFMFGTGADAQIFIGSPDLMPRNLRKRVEIVCPIYDTDLKNTIIDILRIYIEDKGGAYHLDQFGRYTAPKEGRKRAQEIFIEKFSQQN